VRLTELGEQFAARARDILAAVDALGDLAHAARTVPIGRLRLGVIPTVAPYLLPAMIHELGRRYPDLDLRPREAVTRSLVEDLTEGRLDVAVVALPASEPSLDGVALVEEGFVLVRPAADAGKPVPDAEQLVAMRLLLLEEGHCFRDQALSFCRQAAGARPRDLIEGSSLATLVQMVGAGIGVTLIPDMAVPVETRSAAVAIDRFAAPGPTRTVGMVWRRSNPLAGQFLRIAEVIRTSVCAAASSRRDVGTGRAGG
jgi:LysR family hydrogen peroxide-inducible transcriptional activator